MALAPSTGSPTSSRSSSMAGPRRDWTNCFPGVDLHDACSRSGAGGMSLNTTAVRIKVTLKDVKPEVMRRLVVRVTLRLDRLHLTLQEAFGWTNSHLFEFFAGE